MPDIIMNLKDVGKDLFSYTIPLNYSYDDMKNLSENILNHVTKEFNLLILIDPDDDKRFLIDIKNMFSIIEYLPEYSIISLMDYSYFSSDDSAYDDISFITSIDISKSFEGLKNIFKQFFLKRTNPISVDLFTYEALSCLLYVYQLCYLTDFECIKNEYNHFIESSIISDDNIPLFRPVTYVTRYSFNDVFIEYYLNTTYLYDLPYKNCDVIAENVNIYTISVIVDNNNDYYDVNKYIYQSKILLKILNENNLNVNQIDIKYIIISEDFNEFKSVLDEIILYTNLFLCATEYLFLIIIFS